MSHGVKVCPTLSGVFGVFWTFLRFFFGTFATFWAGFGAVAMAVAMASARASMVFLGVLSLRDNERISTF